MTKTSMAFSVTVLVLSLVAILAPTVVAAGGSGGERPSTILECASPNGKTFDTGLGFPMVIPRGFTKTDVDGYDKIRKTVTETYALGSGIEYDETTIWSTKLKDDELVDWEVESPVHVLGPGFEFKSYEVPVEYGGTIYLFAIILGNQALMVQSHKTLRPLDVLACLLP